MMLAIVAAGDSWPPQNDTQQPSMSHDSTNTLHGNKSRRENKLTLERKANVTRAIHAARPLSFAHPEIMKHPTNYCSPGATFTAALPMVTQ